MTTTITAQGPRDLLAYLPFRLGYRPSDCVVLVSLREPRGRVGLVARVDVADLAELERGPLVARTLAAHLVADGARRAVLVVYTQAPLRDGGVASARERAAVEHCRDAVAAALEPPEVWVVSGSGYFGLDCRDVECCPAGGRSLRDIEASPVGAHLVYAGAVVAGSREESLRIPRADSSARRRAVRAARRARARAERAEGLVDARARRSAVVRWRAEGLAAWREAVEGVRAAGWGDLARAPDPRAVPGGVADTVPAAVLGRIEAGLASVPVRDAVLVSLVPGTADLADRTVQGLDVDAGTARAMAAIVDPAVGIAPDERTLRVAGTVLEAVVAHGRLGRQAPALTLLGLLAWWSGDGVRAGGRVAEALRHDPEHGLALLVASALDAGLPPGWVRGQA